MSIARVILFFLAGLTAGTAARAAQPEAPVTDAAQVRGHYEALLREPQYQEPEESFTPRDWLAQWFSQLGAELGRFKYGKAMPQLASLMMAVFVALAMAGLFYVLHRLTRRGGWTMPERAAGGGARRTQAPEFYEKELQRALAAGDWREAWLASWRQFLSRLERERLVEPDRSRTNREYLAQLEERALPAAAMGLVTQAVDVYDRMIYGKRAVTEPDWESFRRQVEEATLLLHLREAGA